MGNTVVSPTAVQQVTGAQVATGALAEQAPLTVNPLQQAQTDPNAPSPQLAPAAEAGTSALDFTTPRIVVSALKDINKVVFEKDGN